jgi:hypothetical protein
MISIAKEVRFSELEPFLLQLAQLPEVSVHLQFDQHA